LSVEARQLPHFSSFMADKESLPLPPAAEVATCRPILDVDLEREQQMTEQHGGAGARIRAVVGSWDGVTVERHRFGGIEFRLGRRELGHIHGDRMADLPFPRRIRDELIEDGRARPHHILPDTGWVTVPLGEPQAVEGAIELFRLVYERADRARRSRQSSSALGRSDA
jgi:hypothetical protein